MKNDTLAGKTALITGASSGIGEAVARRLASNGVEVIVSARRLDRLETLAAEIRASGGVCRVYATDLGDPQNRLELFNAIQSSAKPLDILVNNAGFGWYGYYAEMDWQTATQMVQVNIEATIHFTHLFLPSMINRKSGHIINMGSIAGQIPSQGVVMYSATKGFLDSFTTALYRELVGSGVRISLVRPGAVKTEFSLQAAQRPSGYHLPTEKAGVSANQVANAVWSLLKHPRRVVYVPFYMALTPWVEAGFGWLMDLLGPLHLAKSKSRQIT